MAERTIAEVFPPGDFIKEELEERGWKQVDLAEILGYAPKVVNELVQNKRAITPETAKALGNALGTSAQYWMNLQTAYQLWKTRNADEAIIRRAKIYSIGPIKEILKRQWIEGSENVDVLERQVLRFYEIKNLDERPQFLHAARKSTSYDDVTTTQAAWLYRARHLAQAVSAMKFTERRFEDALEQLKALLPHTEEIRRVPKILAEGGIRLVILEPLPKTGIDGVTFWLDEQSPVIVLSVRFDRIDSFWHTLSHELGHVNLKDGLNEKKIYLDTDLVGDDAQAPQEKPQGEKLVDAFACEFLIKQTDLEDFILRARPLYGKTRITGFARRIKVHPGIVVGQLQHRKQIHWSYYRDMLEKVRYIITQVALTDGWGEKPMLPSRA